MVIDTSALFAILTSETGVEQLKNGIGQQRKQRTRELTRNNFARLNSKIDFPLAAQSSVGDR